MGRWQPDARGRLERAALELFSEQGFDDTTVAAIAERAGLTERTFFRYFANKGEVLFSETGAIEELLGGVVADAPPGTPPLELVAGALTAWAPYFESRRELVERRQAIIASTAELREREHIKLAYLGSYLAEGLRNRGVVEPLASLAAEAGIAVFRVAFGQWVAEPSQDLALLLNVAFDNLQTVTAK